MGTGGGSGSTTAPAAPARLRDFVRATRAEQRAAKMDDLPLHVEPGRASSGRSHGVLLARVIQAKRSPYGDARSLAASLAAHRCGDERSYPPGALPGAPPHRAARSGVAKGRRTPSRARGRACLRELRRLRRARRSRRQRLRRHTRRGGIRVHDGQPLQRAPAAGGGVPARRRDRRGRPAGADGGLGTTTSGSRSARRSSLAWLAKRRARPRRRSRARYCSSVFSGR